MKIFRIKVLLVSDLTLKWHSLNLAWWCVVQMFDFMIKGCIGTVVKTLTLATFVLHFVNDISRVIMTDIAASTRLCEVRQGEMAFYYYSIIRQGAAISQTTIYSTLHSGGLIICTCVYDGYITKRMEVVVSFSVQKVAYSQREDEHKRTSAIVIRQQALSHLMI